jgi:hypothetical protein|tara:strand:+ start:1238 stop:2140 length:903 start_codon:yes stop_codon:yes gene_type:complete
MKIKIKSTIEFEKIKEFNMDPIPVTRNRIAIQQSLDSDEAVKQTLITQLEKYSIGIESLVTEVYKSQHKPLKSNPFFAWQIGHHEISSACWQVERIMPKFVLAYLYLKSGHDTLPDYKSASSNFNKAILQHKSIQKILSNWKWKNDNMNYYFLQKSWHDSMINHLECLQHMSMLSVGIENNVPVQTLLTVADRGVKSASFSIADWSSEHEPENTLPICQAMQMYFSSKLLWKDGKYGHSIYRLKMLHDSAYPNSKFEAINNELDKVYLLLSEHQRINNGAYFETVEEGLPLQTPLELIGA